MKNYDLLEAIGNVNDECVRKAKEKKKAKPVWYKWGAITACFCLMVVIMIIAVYQIQNRVDPNGPDVPPVIDNETDPGVLPPVIDNETNPGVTPDTEPGGNNSKQSIYTISNAIVVDISKAVVQKNESDGSIYTPSEYIEVLKKQFFTVVGEAKNVRSIAMKDGEYVWYITSFDVVVTKAVSFADGSNTIRCVTAFQCLMDGTPAVDCGISDLGMRVAEDPHGLYVMRPITDDVWTFDSQTYNISDYADYYVGNIFDCNDTHFFYYGSEIRIDNIKK